MNKYVTGATIKELRERKRLTQAELAEMLTVSDKAISKWETGKGYPDITLLEPLAQALGVSITELMCETPWLSFAGWAGYDRIHLLHNMCKL